MRSRVCMRSGSVWHSCTVQAAIDGLVLLAMKSGEWTRLATRSSCSSCDAPLESLRRASLALSSRILIENPNIVPGDNSASATSERDDADPPIRKREGGDDDDDCEETNVEYITKTIPSPPEERGDPAKTPAGNGEEGSEEIVGTSNGDDTHSLGRGVQSSDGKMPLSSDRSLGRKKSSLATEEVHLPSGERLLGGNKPSVSDVRAVVAG